jgi:hypothetical protein
MSRSSKYLVAIPTIIIILLSISAAIDYKFDTDLPYSVAVVGSGIMVFCLCIFLSEEQGIKWISDPACIRATIAITIVIQYLVLVGTVALFAPNTNEPDRLPAVTQTLLTNFTTIVGVVIAFFFGSSAYLEGQERRGRLQQKSGAQPAEDAHKS